MRKFFWLFLLIPFAAKAQTRCNDNTLHKVPNSWVFGTYYIQGYSTKLNDSCNTYVNGKPYQLAFYSDGILMYSCSYDISTGKKNHEFHRYLKGKPQYPNDTLIGELKQFGPNGNLQSHNIYYYSTEFPDTRWVRSIHYHMNGKKRYVEHDVYPHAPDSLAKNKPNIYDAFGYSTSTEKCGWHEDYDEQGNILKREYYKLTGVYAEGITSELEFSEHFFNNGKLQARGKYKNNQKDGKWITYHFTGEIASVESYKFGQHIGKSYWFSPNGDTIGYRFQSGAAYEEMQFYAKGKPSKKRVVDEFGYGFEQTWYENGNPQHEIQLENDRVNQNGCGTFWYQDGTIKKKFPCIIENSDTTFVERYGDGKLKELRIEIKGEKGIRTVYFPSGKIQEESTTYYSGETSLTLKHYNEKGTCTHEFIFSRSYARKEIQRYENGPIKSELHFNKDNEMHGTCIGFYENGKVKFSGKYTEGLRDSIYTCYNSAGILIYKNHYKKGIPSHQLTTPMVRKNDCQAKQFGFVLCDSLRRVLYPYAKKILKTELARNKHTLLYYSAAQIDSTVNLLGAVYHFAGNLFPRDLDTPEGKTHNRSMYLMISGLYQYDEKTGKIIPNESYQKLKRIAGEFKVDILDSCVKSGGYFYVYAKSDVIPNLLLLNEKLQQENLNAWVYDDDQERIVVYEPRGEHFNWSRYKGFPLVNVTTADPLNGEYIMYAVLVYPDGTCEFFRQEEPKPQPAQMKWNLYRD